MQGFTNLHSTDQVFTYGLKTQTSMFLLWLSYLEAEIKQHSKTLKAIRLTVNNTFGEICYLISAIVLITSDCC